ncbi:MAG: TonB-dependent receptor [Balneolaceae bacterium]
MSISQLKLTRYIFLILPMLVLLWSPNLAVSQTATVQGIISDQGTGQPLEGASVALQEPEADNLRGMSADQNGFYQVAGLPAGEYYLTISFIGYVTHRDTLQLEPGETRTVSLDLAPDDTQLDEIVVAPTGAGAAGVEAGRQRVTAADFGRVPTPAGGGDLASYLQSMPGVVTTGDRGGHLYIRGGTPAENMILIDGALIFQPFHILGFFSAFPEELVSDADFYAGGFGARYNGRTSSVVDVRMRNGDRYNSRGSASISPFLGEVMVEGPIEAGRSSFVVSARQSLVEETSGHFLGDQYPLRFESQYMKMTHFGVSDTRCSMMGIRTYDRGRLDIEQDDVIRWSNLVGSGRCVILPEDSDMLFDINAGISHLSNETGQADDPELSSSVTRVHLDVNVTRYFQTVRFDYGAYVHIHNLDYDMSELFGGPQTDTEHLMSAGLYTETIIPLGNLSLMPGASFAFHKETYSPTIDPRLRMTWQPWGREEQQLSAAFGLYRQPLVGITGTRDAGSVFTAWMSSPSGDSQMEAVHALLGWRQTLWPGVQLSVEGYRKWLRNLSVPTWSTLVQFTTELAEADGEVYGGDLRLEVNRNNFYGFVGYGFTHTTYNSSQVHFPAWFGEESRSYHPPHDRRHQFNSMASYRAGNYTASVRWQLGSGLPFSQPMGFDEMLRFREKLPIVKYEYGVPRVILEELYQGRMTTYHRLDVSLERSFSIGNGSLDLQVGAINTYDQANMFYYDVYTHRRVDQLPFAPYFSLKYETR